MIELAEFTVNPTAPLEPNRTAVAVSKLLPVMATLVPPASGPLLGLMAVIAGAGGGGGVPSPTELEELTGAVLADVAEVEPTELDAVTTTSIR